MVRGFVTLATGNEKYYKMAVNMLHSFKVHNPKAKMAILCDRENEYTDEFDDAVILENVNGNYKDKFRLLVDSPYEESIFIEPDCLIYHNLDFFGIYFPLNRIFQALAGMLLRSIFGLNQTKQSVK